MSNGYRSVLKSGGVTPTGDAVVADVLAGKTFSNANAVGLEGTMTNNGAVSQTIAPGQSYIIPAGYHNGYGSVSASSYSSVTGIGYMEVNTSKTLTGVTAGDIVCFVGTGSAAGNPLITAATGLTLIGAADQLISVGGNYAKLDVYLATADDPSATSRLAAAIFKIS